MQFPTGAAVGMTDSWGPHAVISPRSWEHIIPISMATPRPPITPKKGKKAEIYGVKHPTAQTFGFCLSAAKAPVGRLATDRGASIRIPSNQQVAHWGLGVSWIE